MSERHLVDRLVGEDRVARAGPAGSKREEQKRENCRERRVCIARKKGRRLQVSLTCRGVRRDSRWELLVRREIGGVVAQRSGSRAGFL